MKRVIRAFLISACATAAAGIAMSYLKGSEGHQDQPDGNSNNPGSREKIEAEQEAALLKELEAYV